MGDSAKKKTIQFDSIHCSIRTPSTVHTRGSGLWSWSCCTSPPKPWPTGPHCNTAANLRNRFPVGGGCVYVLQMFFLFFVFSIRQKYETPVLGNGWTDFHETFTKRYWGKCSLKRCAAAWRMANVDVLRNLRYDSFAITRGCHARRLHYKIVSLRTDLI